MAGLVLVAGLFVASLFVGVSNVSLRALFSPDRGGQALHVLIVSRIPRTLALVLAGTAMALCGSIMQMVTRNKFVEPSTAGTVEAAGLGMLLVMLLAPDVPVIGKMLISTFAALAGTFLFLVLLRRVPLRSVLLVPLIGLMLGGVISAITAFFAYRFDMLQSLGAWMMGDFSGVLQGRYELLWVSFGLSVIAYVAADRFTLAGMGEDFTTNLGLNYRRILLLGLVIVAMATAAVVVSVGVIPFLGLIVPNVVSMVVGDNLRRSLPWVAVFGAAFVLACDIAGRLLLYPYEIPIGTVVGVVGSAIFLHLLLRKQAHAG